MGKEASGQLHPLRRVPRIHWIRSWAFLRWFGHFRDKKHLCFLWESNLNSLSHPSESWGTTDIASLLMTVLKSSLSSDCWLCQWCMSLDIVFRLQHQNCLFQVYIHTEKNVLIEINPQTRIPRTFKRFAGLMGKLDLYIWSWSM